MQESASSRRPTRPPAAVPSGESRPTAPHGPAAAAEGGGARNQADRMTSIETAEPPSSGGLLAHYRPRAGCYDELLSHSGQVRPPWRELLAEIEALGPRGLAERQAQAQRLLRENGVIYGPVGASVPRDRDWQLDPVPLVFAPGPWSSLADALAQRARLLDRVLADCYGPQRLVRRGLVPPELVYGHVGFLRACHGVKLPGDRYLHLYASHLARRADGAWHVLADRSQGPTGAGYAVENRMVISRALPKPFHETRVQRLAGFFKSLRETLTGLAPRHRENPRIVLLTPGPHSPTYFEDVYLARYLGYTLVEGGDLAVRDDVVHLKTLGGLLPVDAILRRLQDEECDPLELRTDAVAGVPGLMQAVRAGTVLVANALGSGLVEAPALMRYLPAVCRAVLDEDLKLPSVPTWWCGDAADRRYVLERLDRLVIKPAMSHRQFPPVFGVLLSADDRERLRERILARPGDFAAQEEVERSTAPVWTGSALAPWLVGLRAFVVAAQDGYQVLPGGLSRVSASAEALGESMSAGQGSKDVWVQSDGPVAPVSLLRPPGASIELRRSGHDLPSRVADNLFWLGRQVERAESLTRLLRCVVARLSSESDPSTSSELPALLRALRDADHAAATAARAAEAPGGTETVVAALAESDRGNSLQLALGEVRRLASLVRDRISVDSWRILNQLSLDGLPRLDRGAEPWGEALVVLNRLVLHLAAFAGMGVENMIRGPGWRFLDMGRRIERSLQTLSFLRATIVPTAGESPAVLEAVLEVADSSMTYRGRYLASLQLAPVLDLVLTDETNPRAVAFQVTALAEHVRQLPREQDRSLSAPEERLMLSIQTSLRLADVDGLCEPELDGALSTLSEFLTRLAGQVRQLAEVVSHTYLVHAGPSRLLGSAAPPPL